MQCYEEERRHVYNFKVKIAGNRVSEFDYGFRNHVRAIVEIKVLKPYCLLSPLAPKNMQLRSSS